MGSLFVLMIYFLFFNLYFLYPLASKGGITVMIVIPVYKLQYKCAALSTLSHVASGV